MVERSDDSLLEILKRIQIDIGDMKSDIREVKGRLGHLETRSAQLDLRLAELSVRMDRRDELVERIMRRLELAEAPH